MKSRSIILTYAHAYAAQEWPVFPVHKPVGKGCNCGNSNCSSIGKHPMTNRGLHDATTDLGQINEWFKRHPNANIGIRTGVESNLVVIDVDVRNGGEDSLEVLQASGAWPHTAEVHTGGGGRHFLFNYPAEYDIRNAVNLDGRYPGIDVRANGGYIVAPPSLHKSGRSYEWEASSNPLETVAIAELPEWLLHILARPGPRDASRPPSDWRALVTGGVEEGQRNDSIARLSGHLLRRRVDPYVVLDLMLAFNSVRCRPPLSADEVANIVDSVARREHRRRYGGRHV